MHIAKITRWGHSAALRLAAEKVRLKIGLAGSIEIIKESVLFRPVVGPKHYSLDEMLAACDPKAPMPADLAIWDKAPIVGAELL